MHPRKIRQDLRENVKDNWMWLLLTPSWMYNHMSIILRKKARGQPVSFTDFFGYLVGETILKDVSLQEPRSHSPKQNLFPARLTRYSIGHFTVVCLVTWPRMQVRLEVTLL